MFKKKKIFAIAPNKDILSQQIHTLNCKFWLILYYFLLVEINFFFTDVYECFYNKRKRSRHINPESGSHY